MRAQRVGPITPRDWVEVGYIQTRRGNVAAAGDAFATAMTEGDSSVRVLAAAAAGNAASGRSAGTASSRGTLYVELYAAPLYQSRFSNSIGQAFVRLGLQSARRGALNPYLSLRVTRDSRSIGGAQPEIYSDNSLVPAAGIKAQPFSGGLTLYAEGGSAIMLLDDGKGSRLRPDVRVGGYFSDGWWQSKNLRTEAYVDASYYSRFDRNVITYAQLREILEVGRSGAGTIEFVTRLGGVGDSKRVSYNNAIEISPGIVFIPGSTRRLALSLEHVSGRYLVEPFGGAPRSYSDWRAMAVVYAVALPTWGAH